MRKSEVSLSLVLAGIDQFPCRYENEGNAGCSNDGASCSEDSDCSTGNTCVLASFEDGTGLPSMRVLTTAQSGAMAVVAIDVNADGAIDVISASADDNTVEWWRIRVVISDTFLYYYSALRYENNADASPPTFTTRVITSSASGANDVLATDIDGDQDIDVVVSVGDDEELWLYEQSGVNIKADPPTFSLKFTEEDIYGINSVFSIDVNGDGINDILTASDTDDKVAWYTAMPQCSNNGASCSSNSDCSTGNTCALAIVKTVVDDDADDAASVYAGDLNGDNFNDVLSANPADNQVAWYENDGSPTEGEWTQHVICKPFSQGFESFAADLDGDGDLDEAPRGKRNLMLQWGLVV